MLPSPRAVADLCRFSENSTALRCELNTCCQFHEQKLTCVDFFRKSLPLVDKVCQWKCFFLIVCCIMVLRMHEPYIFSLTYHTGIALWTRIRCGLHHNTLFAFFAFLHGHSFVQCAILHKNTYMHRFTKGLLYCNTIALHNYTFPVLVSSITILLTPVEINLVLETVE